MTTPIPWWQKIFRWGRWAERTFEEEELVKREVELRTARIKRDLKRARQIIEARKHA